MQNQHTHRCIGLDIGTTTISAAVLETGSGRLLSARTIPNGSDLPSPNGWEKMQDAEKITAKVRGLLDGLLAEYSGADAIGITGQMHGIVYVNREGRAVSPLYTWQDGRAGIGTPSPCRILFERTGVRVSAGYGLATHFVNQQNGEVPADAAKLCTVMDFIGITLTGRREPLTHSSNAASLGFFPADGCGFDREAVRLGGMDPGILPETTGDCVTVGEYCGIPVSVAIGDNQASFMGSVKNPDRTALANFGTGSQISLMRRSTDGIPADAALELRPYLTDSWLASGSALCGGRAYALMERFFRRYAAACGFPDEPQYDVMNALAQAGMESGRFLKVQTTFCGTRNDPGLLGSITGISEELLTPEAMIAGTLWGMASELQGLFQQMPHDRVDTLVISGNAVRKNPALQRMLRQVFGMEVYLPAHREEAAVGAAMFAAKASGLVKNDEELTACVQYETINM